MEELSFNPCVLSKKSKMYIIFGCVHFLNWRKIANTTLWKILKYCPFSAPPNIVVYAFPVCCEHFL